MVKPFHYAIALTGGIATGKSSASKIFKSLGCEIIDADSIAHQILDEQYLKISEYFGESVVRDKKVDRKALGDIVFSNESQRKILEDLLHPLIYDEIEAQAIVLEEKKACYFVDIPLFFENKRYPIHKVLVIAISTKLQLERLMQRDGSLEADAQKRIDTQLPIEEKVLKADYVIDNSNSFFVLEEQCVKMKKKLIRFKT